MKERTACRGFALEIWACWPEAGLVPKEALVHAKQCAACREELESMRSLCRRFAAARGGPLRWSEILPSGPWARLEAATRAALAPPPTRMRPLLWAPGFALAAAIAMLFWRGKTPLSTPRTALPVPLEVVENMELLERLELMENWDKIQTPLPNKGARHG